MKKYLLITLSSLLVTTVYSEENKESKNNSSSSIIRKKKVKKPRKRTYFNHYSTSSRSDEGFEWKLVWSDEFNSGTKPNPKFWNIETGYLRKNTKSIYTARKKNVRIEDGCMVLEAHKEKIPNEDYQENSVDLTKQKYIEYTSGQVTSIKKVSFKYGKIDIRAKLESGLGSWSQLSLINDNREELDWPDCGEMLLCAYLNENKNFITTVFSKNYRWGHFHLLYFAPIEKFHTWSVEWNEVELRFLFDGKLYHIVKKHEPLKQDKASWPFDQNFCFYFDLIIGGHWAPAVELEKDSIKLQIDYVRVYKLPGYDMNSKPNFYTVE
ncbi:glycoside hydrolase family 16 protein [Lentisphaerota bacterium WC36G]|nr:glycoside hydrolase family 16 protein [Lentisphaerae bacterium WC36]